MKTGTEAAKLWHWIYLRRPLQSRRHALALVGLVATAAMMTLSAASAVAANKVLQGAFGSEVGGRGGHVSFGTDVAVNRSGSGGATAGDVYASNWENNRIEQFSAEGEFVRAFGWDVVQSGEHNTGRAEQQSVTVAPAVTAGTFKLSIVSGKGFGTYLGGSTEVTALKPAQGEFSVGDTITGTGIAAGTTIFAVEGDKLTLSQATTSARTDQLLTATESTAAIDYNAPATGSGSLQERLEALAAIGSGGVSVAGGPGGSAPFQVTFEGGLFAHNDAPQMTVTSSLTGGTATVATVLDGGGPEVCMAVSTPGDVCKEGSNIAPAGSAAHPESLAINQTTGNIYVASGTNRRVDAFSATGTYYGSFGWEVDLTTPEAKSQFCTLATGCKGATTNPGAGAFANLEQSGMDVAPGSSNLYITDRGNRRVNEFSIATNGSNEVVGATFVRALGWKVNATTPEEVLQECTTATGCLAGGTTGGAGDGQFPNNTPSDVAVDSGGFIYALSANGTCSATNPCRIQKFNPDGTFKETFGPSTGGADECQVVWTSGTASAAAPAGLAIDPSDQHLLVTRNASTTSIELCDFDSTGALKDRSPLTPLAKSGAAYLRPAISATEHVYLNAPQLNQRGTVYILGPAPPPPGVEIRPATNVQGTSATLNGRVTVPPPGGPGFNTTYHFEYSGNNGLSWKKVPEVDVSVGSTAGVVDVSQPIDELGPGVIYKFRLVGTTASSATSGEETFSTAAAAPSVTGSSALPVTDTTATLRAVFNPNNSATTYRFEYGTTTAYGNRAPGFDPFIGAGGEPIAASASIGGLQPGTTYHFRAVATNTTGTTYGPDTTLRTNACPQSNPAGLPACRGFELVSPADQGPIGESGEIVAVGQGFQFQASRDGSKLAYVIGYGLPDATTGTEVLYRAVRGGGKWASAQLSPPALAPTTQPGGSSSSGVDRFLSDDLSCGVLSSPEPLTANTPPAGVEDGNFNLYRRNPDGSLLLLTDSEPLNPEVANPPSPADSFNVIGVSRDCGVIVFKANFRYPGLGFSGLYEWDHGDLRNVAVIPAPSGEAVPSDAVPGAGTLSYRHAVSEDGDRVFFTATSQTGGDTGNRALFARLDGAGTLNISQSQTATPNRGALYQTASDDGSKVFFLANYGLTGPSSNGASTNSDCSGSGRLCDLYEYDFGKPLGSRLSNLSARPNPADVNGAVVAGVLDTSDDGRTVYFAAQGQLVPNRGNTFAQNTAGAGAYNVYMAKEGSLSFVAVVSASDVQPSENGVGLLISRVASSTPKTWSSRATPDGMHLLFQAQANVTGYDSGGVAEAYLYSADSGQTVCVSCRPDGKPSIGSPLTTRPVASAKTGDANYHNPPLTITDDGRRIFFTMPDALASGAVASNVNLYEWEQGQVSLLASRPPRAGFGNQSVEFMGASTDGSDVFFSTAEALTADDTDGRRSVYDARVGGGFTIPPAPPPPCEALAEGSCEGPIESPPAPVSPATSSFSGEGNEQPAPTKKSKPKKKHKKKSQQKKKKASKQGKKSRGKEAGK